MSNSQNVLFVECLDAAAGPIAGYYKLVDNFDNFYDLSKLKYIYRKMY